ncbi:GATA transcription factor 23-like isoform X1 [Zingiber officinale]|uniref:GATA transcription factor 23-like isoform X1 n=1 Tax=Zingiber officinale TaxID=94328 RepID=UPI001C4CFDB7|nr:GATA transcription factor 23-like isoform X1 [Zingiber officinale]
MSSFDLNQAPSLSASDGEGQGPFFTPPSNTSSSSSSSSSFLSSFSRNQQHDHPFLQQELKDRYRAISYKVKPPQCRPRGNMKLSPRDQIIKSSGDSISIRACSNCSTTKTPLWRSGPHGPKSLCNACGIRQRKVRRAMEAAAVCSVTKEEKPCNSSVPFKKRYKFTSSSKQKKLFVDEAVVVPVKDERDAAILLMGLSCGLIRG